MDLRFFRPRRWPRNTPFPAGRPPKASWAAFALPSLPEAAPSSQSLSLPSPSLFLEGALSVSMCEGKCVTRLVGRCSSCASFAAQAFPAGPWSVRRSAAKGDGSARAAAWPRPARSTLSAVATGSSRPCLLRPRPPPSSSKPKRAKSWKPLFRSLSWTRRMTSGGSAPLRERLRRWTVPASCSRRPPAHSLTQAPHSAQWKVSSA
mmetsp:Transcript_6832/g.15673  ORF Transcript_6832/g.15673 Transcript_6832/m.15673 type:complete len:205 (+) Transcript_6832:255-869(+)